MRLFHVTAITMSLAVNTLAAGNMEIGLNFTAIDRGEVYSLFNNNFTRTPAPDVNGAVGPNHVVLLIKGAYRAFDKSTGAMVQQLNDVDFWNQSFANNGLSYQTTQTRGPSDPRMLFDPASNRWFAVGIDQVNTNNGVLNIAVSNGTDPTAPGAWKGFTYTPAPNVGWADFPTIGINNDGLTICASIFSASGAGRGSTISQIPLQSLLSNTPSAAAAQTEPINAFIANPTVAIASTAGPMPVITAGAGGQNPRGSSRGGNESIAYRLLRVPINQGGATAAPQPMGAAGITVIADRITSNVILRNDEIWGANDEGGAVHWFRLDANSGAVIEEGRFSDPELFYFYPSLAINSVGDVVIGMNGSSGERFVSSFAVAGKLSGNVTEFGEPQLLKSGADTYTVFDGAGRNRWGDYSTTVADPSNPSAFWTFQEIVAPDRTDSQLGFIDNNRAIQITQILIPEPVSLVLSLPLFMLRRR